MGGTNLRAAAVDENGTMLEKSAGSTPLEAGPDAAVADMVRLIQELQDRLGKPGLVGIGIGVPGFIRMETGVIVGWAQQPAYAGFPMRDKIEQRLGTKVQLRNNPGFRGQIVIEYFNRTDLDRLCQLFAPREELS